MPIAVAYSIDKEVKRMMDDCHAEARRLLLYTRKSAKEISAILGFEDLAAFSRFFKKMTGESVSEYRKQAHREELPTVTE